jgi:leader peptidase (prepilin peptidase)/N-methyltransferase
MLPSLVAGGVLTLTLAAIARVDAGTERIPDRLSLPLIGAGAAWTVISDQPFLAHLVGAAAGYSALAGFGWLHFRLRRQEGLGLGDAKLFAAGGAWLGWQPLPLVLLVAAIGGLGYALVTARRRIAFGPWLALAIWLVWMLG